MNQIAMYVTPCVTAIHELFLMDREGVVEPDTFIFIPVFNPELQFAPLVNQVVTTLGAQIERIESSSDGFWFDSYAVIWMSGYYILIYYDLNPSGSCHLNFKLFYFIQSLNEILPRDVAETVVGEDADVSEPFGPLESRDRKRRRVA